MSHRRFRSGLNAPPETTYNELARPNTNHPDYAPCLIKPALLGLCAVTKPLAMSNGATVMPEKARFQFSLRSLLVVTTLCAVFFATLRTLGVAHSVTFLTFGTICLLLVLVMRFMRGTVIRARSIDPLSLHRIASFPSDFDAALVVEALNQAGIRASAVGGYTSGFRAEAPGEVHVVVAQRDAGRARQVLSEMRTNEEEVDWSQVDLDEANSDQPQRPPSADQPGG